MNVRYFFGSLISIPLLPIMYFQGKQIRASVPKLPEAKGIEGNCKSKKTTNKTIRLITIGESTIAGVGVTTHEEGFTGTLAKELADKLGINVSWKVYAKSGYTAKKVDAKLVPEITDQKVDLIVIGLGGNDAFTLNRPRKWGKDIKRLIKNLQHKYPQVVIIFCNMPPIKEFPAFTPLIKFTLGNLVEILGDELEQISNQFDNVYYFGERIKLSDWIQKFDLKVDKKDFFSDGVHPSKLTYQTWAKDVTTNIWNNEKLQNTLKN